MTMAVSDLLVVDWAPPATPRPRALVRFTFDCGIIASLDSLILQRQELEDAAFFPAEEAVQPLPGSVAAGSYSNLCPRSARSGLSRWRLSGLADLG